MATDIGSVFEDEIEASFRRLNTQFLLEWHRFPDTKSAGGGNIIQEQPSDYLLALPPGGAIPYPGRGVNVNRMMFVEAKATDKHRTLQKGAVRPGQRRAIHVYAGLLNLPYLIFHYSALTGHLEIWDGSAVEDARLSRDKLLADLAVGSARKLLKDPVDLALTEFFSLPSKASTIKAFHKRFPDQDFT